MGDRATAIQFAQPALGKDEIAAVMEALRAGSSAPGPNGVVAEGQSAELPGGGSHAADVKSSSGCLHREHEAGPGTRG